MRCDSPNLGLVVPTMSLGGHGTANMTGNISGAGRDGDDRAVAGLRGGQGFKETYLRLLPLLHYTYWKRSTRSR